MSKAIDVLYNGKGKITKIQLQGNCLTLEQLDPLSKALTGENFGEQADQQISSTECLFENPALQRGHDVLVKDLTACNLRVVESKHFSYMVRYKVETPEKESLVFDRYYNGRNQYTRTIFHSKIEELAEIWRPVRKILNE